MSATAEAPLIGTVERVETGPAGAVLMGWCFDLRRKSAPEWISIRLEGVEVARARIFFRRADLGYLGLSAHACGFLCETTARLPVSDTYRFDLFNEAGEPVQRVGEPPRHRALVAEGEIERVTATRVRGWVFEPEDGGASQAHLRISGTRIPLGPLHERPDLVERGVTARSRVGFEVDLAASGTRLPATGLPRLELWVADTRLVAAGVDGVKLLGKLEVANAHGIAGWLAIADHPHVLPTLEVLIDDKPFARFVADQRRLDLRSLGLNSTGGGFNLAWGSSPTGRDSFRVAVRHFETGIELKGSPMEVTGARPPGRPLKPARLSERPLTILVFASDARPLSEACLASVRRHTTRPAQMLVVDTAPRPWPARMPVDRRSDGEALNAAVRGITGDFVLLDGRTLVGPHWLENLQLAAGQGTRTATVSALTTAGGVFGAPHVNQFNDLPPGWTQEQAARAAMQGAVPLWPSIGYGNAACLYVNRAAFDALGGFRAAGGPSVEEVVAEFSMRALRAGWRHVLDDRTLVASGDAIFSDAGAAHSLKAYAEYGTVGESFARRADLATVRYRVARGFEQVPPRPRILYVISTRTGGTPQTNRDLMNGVKDRYDPYLFVCDGEEMQLFHGDDEQPLARHVLERPIDPVLHASEEYGEVIRSWLVRHAIELVHIRHLAWHGLDLPQLCAELGIPSVFSFHDFYMVCPSVKLIDENMKPCAGTCTPTPGPCVSELWSDARMPLLKHDYVRVWRQRSNEVLAPCAAFVTTSESAAGILRRSFPDLGSRLKVIPHGRTFPRFTRPTPPPPGAPFRVLVAGALSRAKGSALVSAAARELRREGVEFHLLGYADDGLDRSVVTLHGGYQRDQFLDRVAEIAPTIGLLPSLWPETYCHVLTEMWAAGLPVLAYDIGAVGERIHARGGGWLFDQPDVALLCNAIRFLRDHRTEIEGRLAEVAAWQAGEGTHQTDVAMAQAYADLYAQVLDTQRALAQPALTGAPAQLRR